MWYMVCAIHRSKFICKIETGIHVTDMGKVLYWQIILTRKTSSKSEIYSITCTSIRRYLPRHLRAINHY